jgi:uncharacterized membrane protein YecN with MAPEG domain
MAEVTSIYAALLAALFILLSARVIGFRMARRLDLGDAGDRQLLKRIRAQGNCAEYAPLGLLLLLLCELAGAPGVALHGLGGALLAGRIAHALGLSLSPQRLILRQIGMVLTFAMLGLAAAGLLAHALL